MSDPISKRAGAVGSRVLDYYAAYLDVRGANCRAEVERLIGGLSTHELQLIREAAVMGYVLGSTRRGRNAKIPPDSQILREVLEGCLQHPDLYPGIAARVNEPAV